MRKPTRNSIAAFLKPFITMEQDKATILKENVDEAMDTVMAEFSGVYCFTLPDKAGNLMFSITSISSRKTLFLEAQVK